MPPPRYPAPTSATDLPERGRRARTSEAKDLVRNKLIETGRKLLAMEGDTPVSLRMIAKHAHYSPGVVYRYFPDRASLFLAIRDAELNLYVARLQRVFDTHDDPEARLRAVAGESFVFANEQAHAFGMNMLTLLWTRTTQPDGKPSQIRDPSPAGARLHALFEAAVLELFADIRCTKISSAVASASLMAVITGAVSLPGGSTYKDIPEPQEILSATIDVLIAGWRAAG